MIRLDSIKLKLPEIYFDSIGIRNLNYYTSSKRRRNEPISGSIYLENPSIGVSMIKQDLVNRDIIISTSAKVLKENYYDGVSLNTIDQYCKELNATRAFHVKPEQLMKATVLSVDPNNTFEVEDLGNTISSIKQAGLTNGKFIIKEYGAGSGFVATKDVRSYKARMSGYDKFNELTTRAGNKRFLQASPEALNRFKENTFRLEQNLTSFDRIKKAFKVPCNNLGSILNSSATPNLNLFNEIISKADATTIIGQKYEDMSIKELITLKGYEGLLNNFDGDLVRAENWIKEKMKMEGKSRNAPQRYIKKMRASYNILMSRNEKLGTVRECIQEVQEKLRA